MAVTSVDWSIINGQSLLASCSDDQVNTKQTLCHTYCTVQYNYYYCVNIDSQVVQWGNIRTTAGIISSWADTWLVYSDLPQVLQ